MEWWINKLCRDDNFEVPYHREGRVEDKVELDMVDREWDRAAQEPDTENIHHQDTQNTALDHYTMLHTASLSMGNKHRKAALCTRMDHSCKMEHSFRFYTFYFNFNIWNFIVT